MRLKILLWIFVTTLLVLVVNGNSIDSTIDTYYESFAKEDFNTYWATQYLEPYSNDELELKKNGLLATWEVIDTLSYSIKNMVIEQNVDLGVASYTVSVVLGEITQEGPKKLSYTMDMTAILINADGWKVISINPTKLVNENLKNLHKEEDIPYIAKESAINSTKIDDDFKEVTFAPQCGDNICAENEDCVFDCESSLEINLPPLSHSGSDCKIDTSNFKDVKDFSINDIPGASTMIGNDKIVEFTSGNNKFYYHVLDGFINNVGKAESDYIISSDNCTIKRILEGANPLSEYKEGNIKLKGNSISSKIKVGFGKLLFTVYSWFKKPPYEIWIEAENGEVTGAGKYTYIGPTSRGPGEAYLAEEGATMKYIIDSKKAIDMNLYISINDDSLHKDDTRSATFNINGKDIKYAHISKNTITEESVWAWEQLGVVTLQKGENIITIKKDKTTSAAFVIDKFVLSEDEISFS